MLFSIAVAACGGGGGGGSSTPASSTLGGAAAVGYPIVNGTIQVKCAGGSALTDTTTSAGAWKVTISGQTLPCAVEVSSGTINGVANSTPYHSIATSFGTVNVTPLTDLMVANLAGTAATDVWFAGLTPAALALITPTLVNTALTNLSTALSGLTPLSTINPITTAFTPTSGNTSDNMLVALKTAMTNTGVSYTTLLGYASSASFTLPAGFGTALTSAYAGTQSGGGTPTGYPITFNSPSFPWGSVSLDSMSFSTGAAHICYAKLTYHNSGTTTLIDATLTFNIVVGGVIVGQTMFMTTGLPPNSPVQGTNAIILAGATLPACGTFTLQFNPASSGTH